MVADRLRTHRVAREVMGMPWSVHVRAPEGRSAGHAVESGVERVFARLAWIDRTFSPFRDDSAVSLLARGELDLEDAARPVREVAELCLTAEALTGGAFSAGFAGRWDPTGLVKGWAIAEAGRILSGLDGCQWSVNAGGDVAVGRGAGLTAQECEPWRIGVEDPRSPGAVAEVVELVDGVVCTSGTSARGSHLVDPATGRPSPATGSVTVTGPDVLWADVWATALFVGDDDTARRFHAWGPGYRVIDQRDPR